MQLDGFSGKSEFLHRLDEIEAQVLEDERVDTLVEYNAQVISSYLESYSDSEEKNTVDQDVKICNEIYSSTVSAFYKHSNDYTEEVAQILSTAEEKVDELEIPEFKETYGDLVEISKSELDC